MVSGVVSHGNLDRGVNAVMQNCPRAAEPIQPFVRCSLLFRQQPWGIQNGTWAVIPNVDPEMPENSKKDKSSKYPF